MRNGTIEANQIWKRFRADASGATYLQDEIRRFSSRLKGTSGSGWRWVLRDINLRAEPGSSIGIFGANGSGKSTFLKILTQVMYPTAGGVKVKGRLGALIEIRGGLHPNLTGRENIFLTGSLMGLPRREVGARLDEIVAFAQLEGAIDRQLKYYSSGMQMRLGFGVAAFLEPEVLLVDEVLAVGDASFQQRCLDQLRTTINNGTTLVLVSHDLAAIDAVCREGLWLDDGEIRARGVTREVLTAYRRAVELEAGEESRASGLIDVSAEVSPPHGSIARTNEALDVVVTVDTKQDRDGWFYIGFSEGTASPIFVVTRFARVTAGRNTLRASIAHLPLPRGQYSIWIASDERGRVGVRKELLRWQPVSRFEVHGPEPDIPPVAVVRLAPIFVGADWSIENP